MLVRGKICSVIGQVHVSGPSDPIPPGLHSADIGKTLLCKKNQDIQCNMITNNDWLQRDKHV